MDTDEYKKLAARLATIKKESTGLVVENFRNVNSKDWGKQWPLCEVLCPDPESETGELKKISLADDDRTVVFSHIAEIIKGAKHLPCAGLRVESGSDSIRSACQTCGQKGFFKIHMDGGTGELFYCYHAAPGTEHDRLSRTHYYCELKNPRERVKVIRAAVATMEHQTSSSSSTSSSRKKKYERLPGVSRSSSSTSTTTTPPPRSHSWEDADTEAESDSDGGSFENPFNEEEGDANGWESAVNGVTTASSSSPGAQSNSSELWAGLDYMSFEELDALEKMLAGTDVSGSTMTATATATTTAPAKKQKR